MLFKLQKLLYSGGIKNVPQPDPIIRTHPYRNGTEQINYDVYDEMEERHMAQCLEGIRVLDIATVIAAPFAAGDHRGDPQGIPGSRL